MDTDANHACAPGSLDWQTLVHDLPPPGTSLQGSVMPEIADQGEYDLLLATEDELRKLIEELRYAALQRTATHCDALRRTATHGDAL